MTDSYKPLVPTDARMSVLEECVAELFALVFASMPNPQQVADTGVARIRKRKEHYMTGARKQPEGQMQSDLIEGAAYLSLMADRISRRFSDLANAAAAATEAEVATKN
jgi:hypothetical protein